MYNVYTRVYRARACLIPARVAFFSLRFSFRPRFPTGDLRMSARVRARRVSFLMQAAFPLQPALARRKRVRSFERHVFRSRMPRLVARSERVARTTTCLSLSLLIDMRAKMCVDICMVVCTDMRRDLASAKDLCYFDASEILACADYPREFVGRVPRHRHLLLMG